ncbi:MAG: hypothetical protein E7312_01855 [Clostridiales bacterium]|nr:hypothetical protein [Clostridiales bacterium]
MERKEIFVTDLPSVFEPKENIETKVIDENKWCSFTYENNEYSGVALISNGGWCPEDIYYDPHLTGWYKIYVTFSEFRKPFMHMKLTSDKAYSIHTTMRIGNEQQEESFWRCADMTGEAIHITKKIVPGHHAALCAFRFVPMSDEEVQAYKAEALMTNTKRMYVHESVAPTFSKDAWCDLAARFKQADVEWYCAEVGGDITEHDSYDFLTEEAHKNGMKISYAVRMGMGNAYIGQNPQFQCMDRNGDEVFSASFAYPEVRKAKVEQLVAAASHGADAVEVIATYGLPYVLFEKPVADAFYEKYGEYPYEYPLDEPRLRALHSDIITGFFRELRAALDEKYGKNVIPIHLRGYNSIEDCNYLGFDVLRLAEEGLIDSVETHARRFYETVPAEIRKDDDNSKIDIEKFSKYLVECESTAILAENEACYAPSVNSRGEQVTPLTFVENVKQWTEFANKTGVRVYHGMSHYFQAGMALWHDNMHYPREKLCSLYENGGEGITIYGASAFYQVPVAWDLYSKAGHKDELPTMPDYPNGYNGYTAYRMLLIDGINYNRFQPIWGG